MTQSSQLSRRAKEAEADAAQEGQTAPGYQRQGNRRGGGELRGRGRGSARAQALMQAAVGAATLDSARFGFVKLPPGR